MGCGQGAAKRIYVAGPMRGYEHYNFPAFDKARDALKRAGMSPVSPADIDRVLEGWGEHPPEDSNFGLEDMKRFMLRDLAAISDCDAIYMLHGWRQSSGAKLEKAFAEFLGLEVFYEAP